MAVKKKKKKKKLVEIKTCILLNLEVDAEDENDYFEKLEEICDIITEHTGIEPDVFGNAFEHEIEGQEFIAYYRNKRKKT